MPLGDHHRMHARSLLSLFALSSSLFACDADDPPTKRGERLEVAPANGSAIAADLASARQVRPLPTTDAFRFERISPTHQPSETARIVMDAQGHAVALTVRNGELFAERWDGTAWQSVAEHGRCGASPFVLVDAVIDSQGQVFAASLVERANEIQACIVGTQGRRWVQRGPALEGATGDATDLELVATDKGVVAAMLERPAGILSVYRYETGVWAKLGPDLHSAEASVNRMEMTSAAGTPVVAWTESASRDLQVRAWDASARNWSVITAPPRFETPNAFLMEGNANGDLLVATLDSSAVKDVARTNVREATWTSLGVPGGGRQLMKHVLPTLGFVGTGKPAIAWSDSDVALAVHNGTEWELAADGLSGAGASARNIGAAFSSAGVIFVGYMLPTETAEVFQVQMAEIKPR